MSPSAPDSQQTQLVVLGSMGLGRNIIPVENLAESTQVTFDAGGKCIPVPMSSAKDIPSIPGELFAKFQTSFYSNPAEAVFKAMGLAEECIASRDNFVINWHPNLSYFVKK